MKPFIYEIPLEEDSKIEASSDIEKRTDKIIRQLESKDLFRPDLEPILVDYISDKILFLDFYEYNSAPGARLARSEYLYLHVKLENGSVIKLKGFASKGGGLVFSTKNYNKAKEILKSGNKMKCFISEGSTSSWSFVINKTN